MNSQSLISLADIYAHHQGVTHWAVSYRAVGKGDFFSRLLAGRECTVKTYTRVLQWFSDHWPLDLFWPYDIPRPEPTPDSPAVQAMLAVQNLNQSENESENSALTALNAKGQIADTAAFCEALDVTRASFDQVIAQYADGRPRCRKAPREPSAGADIVDQLVAANDSRFTARIEFINKYGGGA